tara:strand:+ start:419 stop:781 length:363 start_codon:yes stop_codon:yes gene_type:complete
MWWITIGIVVFFTIIMILSFYSKKISGLISNDEDLPWPPIISKCPDYWELDDDMICKPNCQKIRIDKYGIKTRPKCVNVGLINRRACRRFTPYDEDMTESEKETLHQKTRGCEVQWHGVY